MIWYDWIAAKLLKIIMPDWSLTLHLQPTADERVLRHREIRFQFPKWGIPKHTNYSPSICPSLRNNLPPSIPGKSNHNPTTDSMLSLPASSDLIPFLNRVPVSLFKPVYPSVHAHLERLPPRRRNDKSQILYHFNLKTQWFEISCG